MSSYPCLEGRPAGWILSEGNFHEQQEILKTSICGNDDSEYGGRNTTKIKATPFFSLQIHGHPKSNSCVEEKCNLLTGPQMSAKIKIN